METTVITFVVNFIVAMLVTCVGYDLLLRRLLFPSLIKKEGGVNVKWRWNIVLSLLVALAAAFSYI